MYWFVTTPRSGSNYIMGELLRCMGARVRSQEFFGLDFIQRQRDFIPDKDAPVRSYIEYLTKGYATRGVLGVKILYNQLENFMKYRDFAAALAGQKIVYLYRSNVIKQAISYYLAVRTQQWTYSAKAPPAVDVAEVEYDFSAISKNVMRLERHNALLRRFLIVNQLANMPICYEDFVADSANSTERLLKYLGIEKVGGEVAPTGGFASQSTAKNRDFYERFMSDERLALFGDGSFAGPPLFR